MTAVVHMPGCPTVAPEGGAKGPCMCLLGRERAPKFVPQSPWSTGVDMSGTARRYRDRPRTGRSTKEQLALAVTRIRAAGVKWRVVYDWTHETGWTDPSGGPVTATHINPHAVDAYLATVGPEVAR